MKRYWTGILAALLLALSSLVSAPLAAASDALMASDPAPREELSAAPGGVTLAFDREIAPGTAKVLVLNPDGRNVVVGDLDYFGSSIALLLADKLPKGTYTVRYRIAGAKGQPEGGSFQFSIGPGKWTQPLPDESWSGIDQLPPDLAEPGELPEATPSPDATGSESPPVEFETPTATPSEAPSPTPSESPAPTEPPTTPPAEGGDWWPWAIGGAILVAIGADAWLAARKRKSDDEG